MRILEQYFTQFFVGEQGIVDLNPPPPLFRIHAKDARVMNGRDYLHLILSRDGYLLQISLFLLKPSWTLYEPRTGEADSKSGVRHHHLSQIRRLVGIIYTNKQSYTILEVVLVPVSEFWE